MALLLPPLLVMWIGRLVVVEVAAIDFAEIMMDRSALMISELPSSSYF